MFRLRCYQSEDDYWRIRAFLREVFLLNERRRIAWQVTRFDYWRWHIYENIHVVNSLEEGILIWETTTNQIAAVIIVDASHTVAFQIHPEYRTGILLRTMLETAETQFGNPGSRFMVIAHERDPMLGEMLFERGYVKSSGNPEHQWYRDLTQPLPEACAPGDYIVRPIADIQEWPSRSWCSWRAFHPDEPDAAYEGWEWSLNWQRSPLYRRDLDIVAVAPGGEVAAYCVFWYDDVTQTGLFEPVAVMPEHQRKGLGRAIMTEAMHRAKRMGATLATVSGYSEGANALYRGVLSPDLDINTAWVRDL